MAEINDSLVYVAYDEEKLQKTVTIPAKEGAQISIEKLFCKLASDLSTVTASARAIAIVDGVEKEIGKFSTNSTGYKELAIYPAFVADLGKEVTLKLWLKSSSPKYRAKMKYFTITYGYLEAKEPETPEEPEEPEVPAETEALTAKIEIYCTKDEDPALLAEDLKTHIGDRKIEIYKPYVTS
jgi:hypothetical protein